MCITRICMTCQDTSVDIKGCLSESYYCCDKHAMTKSNLRREEFVRLTHHCASLKKSGQKLKAGIWRPELVQRLWRKATYLMVPEAPSACFLTESRTISPRLAPPTKGRAPPGPALPHQSFIKKMLYSLPAARSYGSVFSVEASFSQMTIAWIKLT